jgi:hypothetical protein
MRYRNVSGHPEDLADGGVVATGAYVELDDEQVKDPHNREKIDAMRFIEAPENDNPPDQPKRDELMARARELDITGTSRMRNDEIQTAIFQAEEKGDDA